MENRSYKDALAGRYTSQLAAKYGLATNYRGVTHPSLPNYLAMTSGSTWGITDDGYHALPAGGLGAQLTSAGISWRAYMEGMTSGGCLSNTTLYAVKHNPFAYYGGRCPSQVVPFTQFTRDVSGNVPRFVWITPNMCHDGHDCSTATADAWLAQTVPTILATKAWKEGGVLLLTWDEGEDSINSVLTIVWHLLADPQARYQDLGPDFYASKVNQRRRERDLVRQLEHLTGKKVVLQPRPEQPAA